MAWGWIALAVSVCFVAARATSASADVSSRAQLAPPRNARPAQTGKVNPVARIQLIGPGTLTIRIATSS